VLALKFARFNHNPTDRQYWTLVAAEVPGKSADECYAKVCCDAGSACSTLCSACSFIRLQLLRTQHDNAGARLLTGHCHPSSSIIKGPWYRFVIAVVRNAQFYEQQPPAKADPARPRKYLSTAAGPPPPGLTQGGRKPGPAKVRQWARQVRFEQRHGGSVGSDDDEDAAQALQEQVG